LTKSLARPTFKHLIDKLVMIDIYAPTWGECWKIFSFLVCYFKEIINLSISISFISLCNYFLRNSKRKLIILFLFKPVLSRGIKHNSIHLLCSTNAYFNLLSKISPYYILKI
jgi:hypothetical protein